MLIWRCAIRGLRRNAIFTTAAVLTLALAIGANTAIFSVVDAMLWRRLPFAAPDRLAMVWLSWPEKGFERLAVFRSLYFRVAEQSHSFARVGGFHNEVANLTVPGHAQQLQAARVTASFFDVLGVPPAMGRTFTAQDDTDGAAPVVVISHALWQKRFAGDPRIVGQALPINGMAHTIVGVMPPTFRFSIEPEMSGFVFRERDVWLPLRLTAEDRQRWNTTDIQIVARLKPGVSLGAARAEAELLRAAHDRDAGTRFPMRMRIESLADEFQGDLRMGLGMLFCAAGCVLLVACANIANLLLARDSGRQSEFALRLSLGSGRRGLVWQALAENLLLAAPAGVLGGVLAAGVTRALAARLPAGLLRGQPIATNWDALWFAAGACGLAVVLFGLGPVIALSRCDPATMLRDSSAMGGAHRGRWFRDALVIGEIAVASCLAITAVALGQSLARLQTRTTGFEAGRVVAADTALLAPEFSDAGKRLLFFDRLAAEAAKLSGVESAGVVDYLPFSGDSYEASFLVIGRPARSLQDAPLCVRWSASLGYLDAMGIPLREGRWFRASDDARSLPVAVVDETAARLYWPGQSPVGSRIEFQTSRLPRPVYTIIGVAGAIRHATLDAEPRPGVYLAFGQKPARSASLVVRRKRGGPPLDAAALRMAMRAVDAAQPLEPVRTLEQLVDDSTSVRRFQAWLMAAAALLALVLAAVGVYGVMVCHAARRIPEIGVRMTLGAGPADIWRLIVGKGALLSSIGTAVGLAGATVLTAGLKSAFYGAGADPAALALGAAVVWLSALPACAIPALRAGRIEPLRAVRLQVR